MKLSRGGRSVLHLTASPGEGEAADRPNTARMTLLGADGKQRVIEL